MIKNYSLVLIAFLCCIGMGFGQITIFSENIGTGSGTQSIALTTFQNSGILTYSGTADTRSTSGSSGYTGASGGKNVFLTNTSPGGYYFEISSINTIGYSNLTLSFGAIKSTIDSDMSELILEYSTDGIIFNSISFPVQPTGTGTASWRLITGINLPSGVEGITNLRLRWTNTSTTPQFRLDDILLEGTPICTDTLDFYNLQSPELYSINVGNPFNVYAKTYEPGVTNDGDSPDDAGTGIEVWIGYNTVNNDPSNAGWTWMPASFNAQIVNDDEFVAEIGSALPTGTYYYASRFRLNGCDFTYGGYDIGGGDGVWDGINDVNGVLTIDQVDWCNLQFPELGNIAYGGIFDVYARVYEPGVTEAAGQGAGIECWIGYSAVDATVGNSINNSTTRTDFNSSNWTWIPAGYNQDYGNDDEYYVNIGSCIPPGNYYYASRFRLNGGAYSYGGITPPNGGSFWDGTTYISGIVTVNAPATIADVVITEIMYNSSGTDDEWIEICNVSGSTQDISFYSIDVGGSQVFTFPCNTILANGDCITVSLGSNGDALFNNGNGTSGNCPFSPDYGIDAAIYDTDNLLNSSNTISLYASNGTSIVDEVTYNETDGADGNGSSLHVIDITQDNSDTGSNWQEVDLGGSAGVNSLLPNCIPMVAEINVEGNLGTYPDITDGDVIPSFFDNTEFAAQFIGASQSKTYRIQNLGGVDLNISNITLTGDTGDFTVTSNPTSPVVYGTPSILEITFSPIAVGTRTAVVHIFNNDDNTDGDTEEEYTFTIRGEGLCSTSSNTITPSSGPVGTVISVTGTNLSTASASFNGIPATVNHISATEMEIIVPNGAVTGNIEIVDDQPCTGFIPFTVVDSQIGGCEGGASLTEIFISEVTDATYGGLSYIELYNPTASNINLSNYSIAIYINGNTDPSITNYYYSQPLSGTIASHQTFVVSTGYSGSFNCDSQPGGDASYSDFNSTTLGGINKKDNEHDYIGLYNNSILIDAFGVFGDNDWMDNLHTAVTGDRGFDFRRLNTSTPLPQPNFDDNDWIIIDWAGSGSGTCSVNDYSDIGTYDFSTGVPPTVDILNAPASDCLLSASLTVSAFEGYVGVGNTQFLTYQWYFSAPGDLGWTAVTNGAVYSGATSSTLNISNTLGLDNYQYYCEVREDDATCYQASNAVRLTVDAVTWDGSSWSNVTGPDINTIAIIDGNYNTSIGVNNQTSFSACNLIVNSGWFLTIGNGDFVSVENNVVMNGEIYVDRQGALVQVQDTGTFVLTNSDAKNTMSKLTAPLQYWYDYTYWSSPLENAQIETALFSSRPSRRFYFDASLFNDDLIEIDNTNTFTAGQDDIDDEGDDWVVQSTGTMNPGTGYAATHDNIGFLSGEQYQYIFEGTLANGGAFNTGDIDVDIYIDPSADYNNWNLIGNPYPCAIDALEFFNDNSTLIEGTIYLWSSDTNVNGNNSGNQGYNFSQDDYAQINGTGGVASSNGSPIPDTYVPSGQGFFVIGKKTGAVSGAGYYTSSVFNNSMRVTGNNNQFFRISSSSLNNRLWANLTSDNGVFSQTLIGYFSDATDDYDGMFYDAPRNLSTGQYALLYSIINGNDTKFSIQGKSQASLDLEEHIQLGFSTTIDIPSIYTLSIAQLEGEFLTNNTIYVKDNYLNLYHDLTESDYNFTSEPGEFNDRFEIVFQTTTLSTDETLLSTNDLTIIELPDGSVKFKVDKSHTIAQVEIIDLLGRTLYTLKGNSSEAIYFLPQLSQSAYIAKVTLDNGQTLSKKAIKKH